MTVRLTTAASLGSYLQSTRSRLRLHGAALVAAGLAALTLILLDRIEAMFFEQEAESQPQPRGSARNSTPQFYVARRGHQLLGLLDSFPVRTGS